MPRSGARARLALAAALLPAVWMSGCSGTVPDDAVQAARAGLAYAHPEDIAYEVTRSGREGDCAIVELHTGPSDGVSQVAVALDPSGHWSFRRVAEAGAYFDLDDPDWAHTCR